MLITMFLQAIKSESHVVGDWGFTFNELIGGRMSEAQRSRMHDLSGRGETKLFCELLRRAVAIGLIAEQWVFHPGAVDPNLVGATRVQCGSHE